MKKLFLSSIITLTLFSCTSDDISGFIADNPNFLPQKQGNYWVYDVKNEQETSRDSLYISGTQTSNSNIYYTYDTQNEVPFGFYSGVLTSGQTRVSGTKLFLTGNLNIGSMFGEEFSDLNIEFTDFLFFDASASQGSNLDNDSGEFEIPYQENVTLKIEYNLYSKSGENLNAYTLPNGTTYNNIKVTRVAVSAKISIETSVAGFPISYPLVSSQDVLISTQYYAKNIGMIYANTDMQYQLNEIPGGFDIPMPESFQANMKETIIHYGVE